MLTKREKEILLSAMSLARGVLKRHGEEGYSVLDYQNELCKAWSIFEPNLDLTDEILTDVNEALAKIHPDWVKGGKK